jgi:hypothetical protein
MSFSRRLTVSVDQTPAIKHNQILMQDFIYNRLLDISDGGIIILRVSIDNADATADVQEKEFFVTVVGPHANNSNVLVSQEVVDYFGIPAADAIYRFTYVKKLPELASVSIKFIENDFCFLDPREAVQAYLEDYHIIYEGMIMQIPSQIDDMVGLVRIESLKPANVCRVPNGEVELEIVSDEPIPMGATTPSPTPAEPTINHSPIADMPYNFQEMKRALFPDLVTGTPPSQAQRISSEPPKVLSKEEVRAARLAYYTKKNNQDECEQSA